LRLVVAFSSTLQQIQKRRTSRSKESVIRLCALPLFGTVLVFAVSGCEERIRGSIPVTGKQTNDFPDMAKISMMDTLAKAQAEYPGKAIHVELEAKYGYLVFQVEIVGADKSTMELAVDAGNGAILGMRKETDKKL